MFRIKKYSFLFLLLFLGFASVGVGRFLGIYIRKTQLEHSLQSLATTFEKYTLNINHYASLIASSLTYGFAEQKKSSVLIVICDQEGFSIATIPRWLSQEEICRKSPTFTFKTIFAQTKFPLMNNQAQVRAYVSVPWYDSWSLMWSLFFLFLSFLSIYFVSRSHREVYQLQAILNRLGLILDEKNENNPSYLEQVTIKTKSVVHSLEARLLEVKKHLQQTILKLSEQQVDASIGKIATQVVHDIRSPLTVLKFVIEKLDTVSEKDSIRLKNAVNRIETITNDLLTIRKTSKQSQDSLVSESSPESSSLISALPTIQTAYLAPLLREVISEKHHSPEGLPGLDIIFNEEPDHYFIFSLLEPQRFQRVVSNLLDNSIKALKNQKIQKVFISLTKKSDLIYLEIKDSGKGLPLSVIENLRLQAVEVTLVGEESRLPYHSDSEGHGIGIPSAIEAIKKWNGKISVQTGESFGTSFLMELPVTEAPWWFVPELQIIDAGVVIVIDNDNIIHSLWEKRFEDLLRYYRFEVHYFDSLEKFSKSVSEFNFNKTLFLVDYDLHASQNGIDLIEKFDIQNRSVLVTSFGTDQSLLQTAKEKRIKVLPKSMMWFVPIQVFKDSNMTDLSSLQLDHSTSSEISKVVNKI